MNIYLHVMTGLQSIVHTGRDPTGAAYLLPEEIHFTSKLADVNKNCVLAKHVQRHLQFMSFFARFLFNGHIGLDFNADRGLQRFNSLLDLWSCNPSEELTPATGVGSKRVIKQIFVMINWFNQKIKGLSKF